MIGLSLSGGGSRAIAFHLGCLRALSDLDILEKISVISTISGGSLIGAYYAYTPEKSFIEFDNDICALLERGIRADLIKELIKPTSLFRSGTNLLTTKVTGLISNLIKEFQPVHRFPSRIDMFQNVLRRRYFNNLKMSSARRGDVDIVIGACDLLKGSSFKFSNHKAGDWRNGELVNWDVDLSFAVTASAAYPLMFPPFDRTFKFIKNGKIHNHRVALSDGGIYDNLGLQVLEPGRNPNYVLHQYNCDYLIVCNAGQGQMNRKISPISIIPRLISSFDTIHRRVQDSSMNRLHGLRDSGNLRGFILPYLGQQDGNIPWSTEGMVSRNEVVSYPTDFSPMSKEWIEKLTNRGEQLTRNLINYYLPEIL